LSAVASKKGILKE